MKKKWKKIMAVLCAATMLVTMPGMRVLADEMQEELIVAADEVPGDTVASEDSLFEDMTDDVDAPITEENIDEEEAEEVVGEGPIQVGDGVTATFDANTGAVEFTSQDGELWRDWVDKLGINRIKIKSIRIASGTVYLPANSSGDEKYNFFLFGGLSELTNLDLSGFDTSHVTDMRSMFRNCSSLKSLDLSSFDISNVTDMAYLFSGCSSLTNLDLSNVDTSNVTDMTNMFECCDSLINLDLSSFDTSNVASMFFMFSDCSSLTNLDLSSFNTSNVTDIAAMFYCCSNLTNLNLSSFDTSSVTSMKKMFYMCSSLTDLDLSGFDTSNVTDMSDMFAHCNKLTNLNLRNVDTSNVTDMSDMFVHCNKLTNLDLSNYDTSNVMDMSSMFCDCSNLTSLDLSNFNTSNVTDITSMFYGCSNLTNLDLRGFDTSNVEEMTSMFYGCSNLTNLDLRGFDTSNVEEMTSMFNGCSSLTNLDISGFDTSNVRRMNFMFSGCSSLLNLDLSSFNTSNVTNMGSMFSGCSSLINLDLSSFNTSRVMYISSMFSGCSNLQLLFTPKINSMAIGFPIMMYDSIGNSYTSLPNTTKSIVLAKTQQMAQEYEDILVAEDMVQVGNGVKATFDADTGAVKLISQEGELWRDWVDKLGVDRDEIKSIKVASGKVYLPVDSSGWVQDNGYRLFGNLSSLTYLDLRGFDTSNVTNMSYMFRHCSSLLGIDLSSFDTSNVTDMSTMFHGCALLTNLDLSSFDTSNVTDMGSMFEGCSNMVYLNLSSFDTSNVTNMSYMFNGFSSFTNLDLSSFDTSNVTNMSYMFNGCSRLTDLDLSSFDTSNVTNMSYMFNGCSSLPNLNLNSFDTSNVTDMSYMFEGCISLPSLDLSSFDTSNVANMKSTFGGCSNIQLLLTPKINSKSIVLPVTLYDSIGNAYTSLPNMTKSIVLAKTQQMAQEYEGQISDDTNYCSISNGPFFFRSGLKNDDSIEYSFDYDDNWLFSNIQNDRYKLMKTSIRVALAAFGTKTDNDYGAENIKKMMDIMRFTYTNTSITYEKPENDSIGSAIGMKNIKKQDGSTASIILVALRGGGYGAEWGGNFRVGAPNLKDHGGFRRAATTVEARLEEFYKTNRDDINKSGDFRIWVTGYSRAAAVANLVAADLIDGNCNIDIINPEKVMAFCFECPQNVIDKNAASSKYSNIINIVNPIDFVPKMAFSRWDFTRYGKTYYIPSKEVTAEYEKKYKYQMIRQYQNLCDRNDIAFKEDYVVEVKGQASILNSFLNSIAKHTSRKEYYKYHENAYMELARTKLGGSGKPAWGDVIPELVDSLGVSVALHPVKTGEVIGMFINFETGPGPVSHFHELCMSWIDSLGSFSRYQTSENSWYREVIVNCPVEVIVIDSSGSIVGHIVNDTVEEIEDGIVARIDGDGQKVFILPQDEEYEVKVIAEEDATINYTVEEYNFDSNEIEKVINYKKIDAVQGEEISGTASIGNSVNDAEYTLKYTEKEEVIEPDEVLTGDDIELFAVDVSCVGQGSVTGGGVYTNGEFAQVTAVPDDGFEFIGWFVENELVSKEEKYRFGVEKNILLEARFSNSSSEIEPTPIPTITPIPTPTTIPNAPGAKFSDVQDPSHPYYKAIYWAAEKKITGGYKDGTFGINKPCTRGHAVMFLWKMEGAPAPKDAEKTPFPDVPKTHPYYKAVLWAQQKGITKGYTSGPNKGKFGIDDTCTRGQIMTFIWNYKGKPTPKAESKSPFSDVPTTHPYYKAILWGSQNGVTKGYTSGPNAGNFGINDSCTRGQIVKFLYNIR